MMPYYFQISLGAILAIVDSVVIAVSKLKLVLRSLLWKRFDYIFEASNSGIYIFDSKTNLKLLLYALLVYLWLMLCLSTWPFFHWTDIFEVFTVILTLRTCSLLVLNVFVILSTALVYIYVVTSTTLLSLLYYLYICFLLNFW